MRHETRWQAIFGGTALVCLTALIYGYVVPSHSGAVEVPLGLSPVPRPEAGVYSPAKCELGRDLFYDTRLSPDRTVSCATCHNPRFAFSVPVPFATGFHNQRGDRKAPSIINAAYGQTFFWDARAATLEDQALGPILNPTEMGNTATGLVSSLKSVPGYRKLFRRAFGDEAITLQRTGEAIAEFERTILSGDSPYDRWKGGDHSAMTVSQIRGAGVFEKAKCSRCHEGCAFTNGTMANLGVGTDKPSPDTGRYAVTHDPADWGQFKTPGLREVALRAPYMHDGSLRTLEDVIEYYDRGGVRNRNLDHRIVPLHLSAREKADPVAFLRALNGRGWQNATAPESLPQ